VISVIEHRDTRLIYYYIPKEDIIIKNKSEFLAITFSVILVSDIFFF